MSDAHRDLRSWIARLRDAGELVDVHAEVDPYLEISEIVDRTVKRGVRRCCSTTSAAPSTRC